jgi:transcriptional regulator with XRE-family HTH domain
MAPSAQHCPSDDAMARETKIANSRKTFMPRASLNNPIDKHVGSRVRMRRMMLGMSQTKLADAMRLTYQQVQKYETGTNRMSASKLQQSAHILQVPVTFFFEGAPSVPGAPQAKGTAPSPAYVTNFLATSDGLALMKAFTRIKDKNLRHCIVDLVDGIADQ